MFLSNFYGFFGRKRFFSGVFGVCLSRIVTHPNINNNNNNNLFTKQTEDLLHCRCENMFRIYPA